MLNILQTGLLTGKGMPLFFAIALPILISVIVPYLLGSINSAVLISRLFYGADIRTQGSGNGGLTNMHRVYGGKAAGLVLLGDVLKMVLSLLIVGLFYGMQYGVIYDALDPTKLVPPETGFAYAFASNPLLYVAGTLCILGHIFPVYFKFKGGKGVLCTAAMVLVLSPIVFVTLFLVFLLILLVTHYVSLSSMVVGLLYPFVLNRVSLFFCGAAPGGLVPLLTILVGLLILYCHRTNLVRLKEKRENKFYFRKRDDR